MKLTFQNSNGKERVIADVASDSEAYGKIKAFCNERGFPIHYTRICKKDGVSIYDVGSHFEFFVLYPDDKEQKND